LLPLIRSVVENVARSGAGSALTGPVARGDLRTVVGHLRALAREDPALADLYRRISMRAVSMAELDGRLDAGGAAAVKRLVGIAARRLRPSSTAARLRPSLTGADDSLRMPRGRTPHDAEGIHVDGSTGDGGDAGSRRLHRSRRRHGQGGQRRPHRQGV